MLHNRFHDILPGSSIKEVYDGTDKDYAELAVNDGSVSVPVSNFEIVTLKFVK